MKTILMQRMFLAAASVLLAVLTGCGDKDITSGQGKEELPRPEWVDQRPHSGSYYIGVGSSSKTAAPLDYQAIAKKNALNDLASEISVRVKGETFLNSLEVNKNFSEEFISTISTTTDEQIEDYEIAGTWENKEEYWVYYRLNKASYQQKKAEKKNMAMSAAWDYYLKGREAEDRANIPAALDLYMHGLFAMKDYWNEVNEYRPDSTKVFIDNEMYASIRRILTGLELSVPVTKVVLSGENNYRAEVPVTVIYEGTPVKGITVNYSYERERYMKPRVAVTDPSGKIIAEVSDVNTNARSNNLSLSMDVEPLLPADLDPTIQRGLIRNLKTDSRQIPIELVTPSFFITSSESSFGKPSSSVLGSALQGELVKRGMRISPQSGEANYSVAITSNTTDGGSSQGFTVAYLEMTITVKNTRTGEIVYNEALQGIKGVQLNLDAAGVDAYKKGKEKIESEIVKSVLAAIL